MASNLPKPKVIVCGAGIGGLTVAHELAKRNFAVTIYEQNKIVGGLARSSYHTKNNQKYPTEYSWRVYGANYKNLLRLINEIPLRSRRNRSVFHNLVQVCTYIFPRFGKEEVIISRGKNKGKLMNNFKTGDIFKIIDKILYCLTMSTRRADSLDHIKWKDYCQDLSPEAKKYMIQLWGPVLGMDTTKMSFPVIARMVGILLGGLINYPSRLYLMNKPTNDGWFDEWTDYLQNTRKVKIKTGYNIVDFKMKNGMIDHVFVNDQEKNETTKDTADYYVCALPVEAVAGIVSKNPQLAQISTLQNTIKLAEKCRQIQLSVQLFLDQEIIYPSTEKVILYLPDTPWSLIIEPQDLIWGRTYCTDQEVKAVLSVGICQTDKPGILYNKPFIKCTKDEIKEEVWSQILKSCHFSSIAIKNKRKLDKANIVFFYIWDSFQFDRQKKEMEVWEPKFSNNSHSLKYQPDHATEIPNFLFATGYTKTDRYIYSMESAAEAGTLCANEIIRKQNQKSGESLPLTKIHPFSGSTIILKPLIFLDSLLYTIGLPHLSKLTVNSIFLVAAYALILLGLLIFFARLLIVK
ncbi:FAD-dependent oxidoreductase [Candidatus Woesearchaeota archaeon]|nr:FAD-dependent oxidoreductase [Candidatus Woesearchaeota archaeon]